MATVEINITDLQFFEFVGGGSFGSVYRGFWTSHEQIVAIKKHTSPDSSKEVAILSKLSHRNIIQLYGAVTVAPNYCFVTEFASEGSLYHYLQNHHLEFPQILTWARQIALGMNYLHHEAPFEVIHRDLKSKNIVLSEDLTAKICDFGCARFSKNTTKLSLAGTFPWMAPEAIQQSTIGTKSDVFSYGVVVWELLTSEVPFKGLEGIQVAWLVVHHKKRLTIPSSCPKSIASLMTSCWQEDPKNRPDFHDVLAALRDMSDDDELPGATETFLGRRDEWTAEIEVTLQELKKIERNLNSREKVLAEREMKLEERERELQQRVQKPPVEHDVTTWTQDNVCQWIRHIASEGGREDLAVYADVFLENNINGVRLLGLGGEELTLMVKSLGHRKDMQKAIDNLRDHNERLRNFPPLDSEGAGASRLPSSLAQQQVLSLTVIFGNHFRKGALPDQRKWKMYVELDGPDQALLCIERVRFQFAEDDIITISNPPFLMQKWRSADKDTQSVECFVDYGSSVKKPRKTFHVHTVDFTGEDCSPSKQYSVLLTLKRRASRLSLHNADGSAVSPSQRSECSEPDSGYSYGTPSHPSSINSERRLQFDSMPGLQPRKLAWGTAVAGTAPAPGYSTPTDSLGSRPDLSRASSTASGSSASSVCGVSPVAAPNNPWFSESKQLTWPKESQAKTVVAAGPTIPSRSKVSPQTAQRRTGGAMSRQYSTPMFPKNKLTPSPKHAEKTSRPLGESSTLPTSGRPPPDPQKYRRSVSDAPYRAGQPGASAMPPPSWPGGAFVGQAGDRDRGSYSSQARHGRPGTPPQVNVPSGGSERSAATSSAQQQRHEGSGWQATSRSGGGHSSGPQGGAQRSANARGRGTSPSARGRDREQQGQRGGRDQHGQRGGRGGRGRRGGGGGWPS